MAYKFKRYKIKWSLKRAKFKKKKIDRKKSMEAHRRFLRNKSKMLSALRRNRQKIKTKKTKNRNAGMYKKLSKARRRFKYLLKNSLEYEVNQLLFEDNEIEPEIEIDDNDLDDIIDILGEIETDDEELDKYVKYSIDFINHLKENEPNIEDKYILSNILRFIDKYFEIKNEEE